MLAHVPMAVHPRAKNVLVIGGGDGGTVRELTKYRSIETIDLVEVDKSVVLLAKKHFCLVVFTEKRTSCVCSSVYQSSVCIVRPIR